MAKSQIGSFIRAARFRANMSQGNLATKARMTRAWVSDVENGRKYPRNLLLLSRIAEALNVPLYALLLQSDSRVPLDSNTDIGEVQRWSLYIRQELADILDRIGRGETSARVYKEIARLHALLECRPEKPYDRYSPPE